MLQVIYIQQPDLSEPVVPAKEKKFRGYFKIARHYGLGLNQTFMECDLLQVGTKFKCKISNGFDI